MPEQSLPTRAVFLSYASQDADAAARICEALRAAGVEVWLDKTELRGGDAWDSQIKKQIHDCALFVPLISAHTNARSEGYFRGEWHLATRRLHNMADDAAFLLPVVVDDTREADARVPEEFFRAHWTWLPGGETPPAFAQRVRQLLGMDPASGPRPEVPATGVFEPSARSLSAVRPRNAPLVRRFAIPLVVLLAILGGGAFWYLQSASDAPAVKPLPVVASSVSGVAPNEKSIAVLPFVDMSAEKNQEYMSDGIAEELLNLLSKVPDVKVIARTSSFAFKGQNIEITEIAKKLNVTHVVEGSVRTSGNKLRITAQLIRTADSTHLWSESYDRPLDDIFAVQDEIASAIVQALQIKFLGGTLSRREGGTQNLEAYQLYLRANDSIDQNTKASLDAAEGYAEQAIKLDPSYGRAWYALADCISLKADNGYLPATDGYERGRLLAQRALNFSPDLVEAGALLGYIHHTFDWNWAAAEIQLRRTLTLDPTNSATLNALGKLSYTLGRWEDAERYLRTALVRDPLNPYVMWNLGNSYYLAGKLDKSNSTFRQLLATTPSFGWTRSFLAKTILAMGNPREALEIAEQDDDEFNRMLYLTIFLQAAGRQSEADEALKAQIKMWADTGAFYVAQSYAHRGNHDLALEWLEKAYKQKDAALVEIVGESLFKGMADDPRYRAFLRKMNLPE